MSRRKSREPSRLIASLLTPLHYSEIFGDDASSYRRNLQETHLALIPFQQDESVQPLGNDATVGNHAPLRLRLRLLDASRQAALIAAPASIHSAPDTAEKPAKTAQIRLRGAAKVRAAPSSSALDLHISTMNVIPSSPGGTVSLPSASSAMGPSLQTWSTC